MFIIPPVPFFMRPVTSLGLVACGTKEFDRRSPGMAQGPVATAFLWAIRTLMNLGFEAYTSLACSFFFHSNMGVLPTHVPLFTGFRMWVKLRVSRRVCGWLNLTTVAPKLCWRSFTLTQCFG